MPIIFLYTGVLSASFKTLGKSAVSIHPLKKRDKYSGNISLFNFNSLNGILSCEIAYIWSSFLVLIRSLSIGTKENTEEYFKDFLVLNMLECLISFLIARINGPVSLRVSHKRCFQVFLGVLRNFFYFSK